jgi:hypothetical protein
MFIPPENHAVSLPHMIPASFFSRDINMLIAVV